GCYYMRWPESRVKKYTTSEDERAKLLAARWRDDGIAFYAPMPGTAETAVVHSADDPASDYDGPLYVAEGAELQARTAGRKTISDACSVYASEQPGSEPLMRVYYAQTCGRGHDELAAGVARFNKAYKQGTQPIAELHWSGLDEETTLVVEALDALCPYQG